MPDNATLEQLADESAIRRLLAEYCQTIDDGRFEEWIDLFAEDIVFRVMGMTMTGRDQLRSFIEPSQGADQRGKHMISEPVITIDGDYATATTDIAFVSKDNDVSLTGRYNDQLIRHSDRWRFTARDIIRTGETTP